ncbi:MFS transporter [Jiella sp. MQZ9-1]|uniref:MFS transporter n=1 Tax=Jiella flava TaxID=2816857 RepID=A0A939FW90_9HYPH|nr:MFS transporter [Jiella flava]MBO0662004.1 MFS transporter [Jiella flava]MCD2470669.1 MFS transporter [Jiella flava]
MTAPTSPATHARPILSQQFPPARRAVALAFFVNGFGIGSWAPQVPVLAARLDISAQTIGLLIFVFGLGGILTMPLIARAIGRVGSRPPLLVTHFAAAVAFPSLILAPDLAMAVVAIFLFGAAFGGMDAAMNAGAITLERHMDRAIMSSSHGFWSIGGFVGSGFGGPIIAAFGPAAHAGIVAAVILSCFVFVQRMARDDRDAAGDGPTADNVVAGGAQPKRASAVQAAGLISAFTIGLFALLAMLPEGGAIDWSALYLRTELNADIAASGFGLAAFSITMATFRFFGDGIRNRLGAVKTVRLFAVVAACGLIVAGLAGHILAALFGFALAGIGLANIVPIAFSAAGNVKGLPDGTGITIATAIGYSGGLMAPSIIGFLADHVGLSTVYLAMAGLLGVIVLLSPMMALADRQAAEQP